MRLGSHFEIKNEKWKMGGKIGSDGKTSQNAVSKSGRDSAKTEAIDFSVRMVP